MRQNADLQSFQKRQKLPIPIFMAEVCTLTDLGEQSIYRIAQEDAVQASDTESFIAEHAFCEITNDE